MSFTPRRRVDVVARGELAILVARRIQQAVARFIARDKRLGQDLVLGSDLLRIRRAPSSTDALTRHVLIRANGVLVVPGVIRAARAEGVNRVGVKAFDGFV